MKCRAYDLGELVVVDGELCFTFIDHNQDGLFHPYRYEDLTKENFGEVGG